MMSRQRDTKTQSHAQKHIYTAGFFQLTLTKFTHKDIDQPKAIIEVGYPRCHTVELDSKPYSLEANFNHITIASNENEWQQHQG